MTGSLQTKNGKYYAVINLTSINGKRKQKWISTGYDVKGNKKKAEQFLRDKLKEYELQENLISSDILFSDYLLHWLELNRIRLDRGTYLGYLSVSKNHIVPYFAERKIKLNSIKREDIQGYVNYIFESGMSATSVKLHAIVIRQTLKEAVKSNLLSSNPCLYVELPKLQKYKADYYNATELQRLFDLIKNEDLYPLIYFTAIYGLRRSEVLGLKWDSIDFVRGSFTVNHTVVRYSEIVEKDCTKTKSSCRTYPLFDETKNMLLKLKERENDNRRLFGKEYIENDYVFKWDNGKIYAPDFISRKFGKLLSKYNLRKIRFHDLRHSCATLLLSMGFQIKEISEWLGHADIQTTADIYAHLDYERKNAIADSLAISFG